MNANQTITNELLRANYVLVNNTWYPKHYTNAQIAAWEMPELLRKLKPKKKGNN